MYQAPRLFMHRSVLGPIRDELECGGLGGSWESEEQSRALVMVVDVTGLTAGTLAARAVDTRHL